MDLSLNLKNNQIMFILRRKKLFASVILSFLAFFVVSFTLRPAIIVTRQDQHRSLLDNISASRLGSFGDTKSLHTWYHVGVLTSYQYLSTRAKYTYSTWGKTVANLSYYVGEIDERIEKVKDSSLQQNGLPIHVLKGISDSVYPPREKSFKMIQYWCDHLLDQYDWFIKTDDDTYLKTAYLEAFLNQLDPSKKYYIGRPGAGLKFERAKLDLYGNFYCTGPMVIYSKPLLKDLCPHIESCLKNFTTAHEDTEVGRCVLFNTGLQCSKSYSITHNNRTKHFGLATLFRHSYNKTFYAEASNGSSKVNLRGSAISLHAIKDSWLQEVLHSQYLKTLPKVNVTNLFHNLHVPMPRARFNSAELNENEAPQPGNDKLRNSTHP